MGPGFAEHGPDQSRYWGILLAIAFLVVGATLVFADTRSTLPVEPGTISVEGLLDKPVTMKVKAEAPIYFLAIMDHAVGSMAPGTVVTLIGISDTMFRVRGRARHGDVAGWMKKDNFLMADPKMPDKLKALYERAKQIDTLVAAHQAALGMTSEEIQLALGKPTRKTSKITAAGREDKLEYAIFDKVPQSTLGRAPDGQLVQSIIYIKVETGTLTLSFKNNIVDAIEETKGNPLKGGQVQIVPGPIIFR